MHLKNIRIVHILKKKSQISLNFEEIIPYLWKVNHAFKKNQPWDKFMFRQLVKSFADFGQNNSIIMQKKKNLPFKNNNDEKSSYFDNNSQIFLIFCQNDSVIIQKKSCI